MNKKIIAVDFDGTLVFNEYPKIENPNLELINFIKRNRKNFIWILYTARHDIYLEQAVNYLKNEFGLEFDYVNENEKSLIEQYGDCRKIVADYYIDDRNISINELLKKEGE